MPQTSDPYSGTWYTADPARETAQAWYREADRPAAPPPPPPDPSVRREPTEEQRRRHRRTKIISLTVCGVLVCAALAMAVWNGRLLSRIYAAWGSAEQFDLNDYEGPGEGYSFRFGEDGEIETIEPYEDFRDFFDNYYTGSNEIALPAAPNGTGVTLDLHAQRGSELSFQEIYDRVSPAVVGITAYMDELEYSWGTGVVFTRSGYLITNTHIIQGCDSAKVILTDGRQFEAQLVGADEASDIAVLRIDGEDLPCAEFGRSDSLQVGDTAVAIGNPLGQEYTGTMTNGIISAIDRNVTYEGHTMTLLQTNAALNEGNSGGPLINSEGQVIGITNMKIMSGYYTTVEGIGFAIPSSVVKAIADQLIAKGVVSGEPTIGIVAGPVPAEAMSLYDLPSGIYVTEVSEGSDAKAQGVRRGDVITAVDGVAVTTVAEVNAIKESMAVGDTLTLSIYRDGKILTVEIALVDKADIQ